jgi:hypothetical protein
MIRAKSNVRVGILGATAGLSALLIASASASGSQAGTLATGPHANEPFCKTSIEQGQMLAQFVKADLSDPAKRTKYFAGQKELNGTLVKQAPASLAADVALQTKNANASIDAQLSHDPAKIKASMIPLRSPENLAASRHMTEYCGVKATVVK